VSGLRKYCSSMFTPFPANARGRSMLSSDPEVMWRDLTPDAAPSGTRAASAT
jgi:hypothetical protein